MLRQMAAFDLEMSRAYKNPCIDPRSGESETICGELRLWLREGPLNMGTSKAPLSEVASFPKVGRLRSGDVHAHAVKFYEEDSSLIDELSRFVGTALGSGEAAIIAATKEHREALAARLESRGFDISRAVSQGRYFALDAAATLSKFMCGDQLDAARFAQVMLPIIARAKEATEGEKWSVVIFGEMVALLWAERKPGAALALEQLWNDLAGKRDFTLLCAYPMNGFGNEEDDAPFMEICAAHSHVIPSENYTKLETEEERSRSIAHLQQREQVHEGLRRVKKDLETEIVQRIKAEQKLRESERSLRDLSGSLLRIQEEERRHLGRKLHEGIGQYLVALKMGLDLFEPAAKTIGPAASFQIGDCRDLVERTITEIQTMSHLLYPPLLEEMGLSIAIPGCLDGFAKRSGIETKLEMPDSLGRLPGEVELVIFRVLQECLINVQRNSGSSVVQVRLLVQDGNAQIEVRDNGKGMPAAILRAAGQGVTAVGVGFRGLIEHIRQLGGKLELSSSEEGVAVIASVPCEGSESHENS
jgi:signal transduction histidine kinase